jgi:regulatory protein YycI of two-component signal transduction system YycFG
MDSLILTNILLIIIIVFLFAIYKDLNNRVCNLIEQLGRNLNKLNFTANHIKHFILMNDKEKAEAAKIIEKEVMLSKSRIKEKEAHKKK